MNLNKDETGKKCCKDFEKFIVHISFLLKYTTTLVNSFDKKKHFWKTWVFLGHSTRTCTWLGANKKQLIETCFNSLLSHCLLFTIKVTIYQVYPAKIAQNQEFTKALVICVWWKVSRELRKLTIERETQHQINCESYTAIVFAQCFSLVCITLIKN